jgi:uncharacterized integral membrane protein
MSSLTRFSRTAIKFLLVANILLTVTAAAFGIAAWCSDLPLFSKLLSSLFAGGILMFVVPDAFREFRLLYPPRLERPCVSAED